MAEHEARWALTENELSRIETLSSQDELIGTYQDTDDEGHPRGPLHQVVVLRDGTVTDRYCDGTIGVPEVVMAHLQDEDTLYHPGGDELPATDRWVNVVVSDDGDFVRTLDAPAPKP